MTIIWNADPVYNLVICTCTSVCIVHILITALKVDVLWKHRWKHHWKRVVKEMFNILVILNFIFLSCSPYSRNITRPFPSIKKTLDLTEKAEWRSDWYTTVYGNLRLRTLARRERIKSSNIIRLQLILTVVNLHIVSGRADALRHWFESDHRYTVLSYCPYKKISLFVLDRKYM